LACLCAAFSALARVRDAMAAGLNPAFPIRDEVAVIDDEPGAENAGCEKSFRPGNGEWSSFHGFRVLCCPQA